MELVNLGYVSQSVMNRDNDLGESVIQIRVVKVYYASPTVDRHTGRGGVERQPCAVPIHVSVKSHPEVPSAARNQEAEKRAVGVPEATLSHSLAVEGPGEADSCILIFELQC